MWRPNDTLYGYGGTDALYGGNGNDRITDFKASEGDMLFFSDFFTTKMDEATFLNKYVTDLAGHIGFGIPA